MKPHLPLKLRAALLAALVAVSFTVYSPAWAAETGDSLTETKVYEHNEPWTKRITGSLTLDSYAEINISNNEPSGRVGGAISLETEAEVSITNSGNILFESNSASGGAINNRGTLTFSGNEDITFSGNSASDVFSGCAIYNVYGGKLSFTGNRAITFSSNSGSSSGAIRNDDKLTFSNNGDITFAGNFTDSILSGIGAIYNSRKLSFTGNRDIIFSGNYAPSDRDSYGGAIVNWGNSATVITFSGNRDITFSGNYATTSSDDGSSFGGAICNSANGTLSFSGNGCVLFEKNYEKKGSSYRLRSIYSDSGSLYLAAKEGGCIAFKDSLYSGSNATCFFNACLDENGSLSPSYGEIIFTGESTEADLAGIMGSTPTEAQITESRTSYVGKAATLYGGTLTIREQAILLGAGLTVRTSATKGGTRVSLRNGTLSMSCSDIVFQRGTVLDVLGRSSIVGNVAMADGSTLQFTLGESVSPILTLTGTLEQEGNLLISLAGNAAAGTYTLLSVSYAFDKTSWTEESVTVTGASFADLSWDEQGKTLYLDVTGSIDPSTENVVLSGNQNVTNNTVISGNAKVEVNGKGTLTLTQTNSYTGGTTIMSGTLVAGADGALGKGDVTIYGGKLDIGGHALTDNKVWVKDTSRIAAGNGGSIKSLDISTPGVRDGDGTQLFGGVLTLTGTLKLDSLRVRTGAVSGGFLRVRKTITAEGGTIAANLSGTATFTKSGRGTLTLKGRNNWTGRTTINEGRLVIAGQSTVTSLDFNGGSLAVTRSGSLTVTNVFSVCGHEMELSSPITLNTSMDGNLLDLLRANGCEAQNENGAIVFSPGTPVAPVAILLADVAEETGMTEESADGTGDEAAESSGEAADAKAAGEAIMAAILAAAEPAPSVGTDALAQGTWGVAKAARLFADTVRDHAGMGSTAALDETGTRSAWFSAMSGFSRTDSNGVAAGATTDIYGGALGMQFNGSRGGNAGIAVGQTWGHISPMGGSSRVTQKTQHAALYANKVLVNRERDFAGVSATAAYATTDSDTVQDGRRFDWAQQSTVLGLRGTWVHHISNATAVYCYTGAEYLATDSAATENAESGSVQSLKWEAGAGVSHTAGKLTVYADAAFRPDIVRHNPVAESDGLRGSVSNPGRLEFRATVGADYRVDDHWSINAGYSYEGAARENNHNLRAGVGYTF